MSVSGRDCKFYLKDGEIEVYRGMVIFLVGCGFLVLG